MACACQGNGSIPSAGPDSVYIFTDPTNGRQTTYRTMYEAKYAKMRAGGGNIRVEQKT